MQPLSLGISPCPNDTFIFDHMLHGPDGEEYVLHLEDVETLNQWALEGRLDVSKISFAVLPQISDEYQLLQAGAALGRGVGPLLVQNPKLPGAWKAGDSLRAFLNKARIAIPGIHTTANRLLTLAFPEAIQKTEIVFSEIESGVMDGQFDAGLLIHEGRFTYHQRGLEKLLDLGQWWEETTGVPIPLGCIVARKSLGAATIASLEQQIRLSLKAAWEAYPSLSPFVQDNAQEMDEAVMRQHIELYVNDYTMDLGAEGNDAVARLFTAGQ